MINPELAVTEQYPDNILQRLEAAEQEILSIRRELGVQSVTFNDTAVSTLSLFPDVGVEVTDPTDPAYSGGFACGEGLDFGGVIFTFGYVKAGVIQWGGTGSDAALWAGKGAIKITEDGLVITDVGDNILFSPGQMREAAVGLDGDNYYMAAHARTNNTELSSNGGFESDLTGWTTTGGTPVVSTSEFHSGAKSVTGNSASPFTIRNSFFTSSVGKKYMVTFWAKNTLTSYADANVSLRGYNSSDVAVGTSQFLYIGPSNGWRRYIFYVTMDGSTTAKAAVSITAKQGVYVDDVSVIEVSAYGKITMGLNSIQVMGEALFSDYVSFRNGIIVAGGGTLDSNFSSPNGYNYAGDSRTINSDGVYSFTPGKTTGMIVVISGSQYALVVYSTASPSTALVAGSSGAAVTTGVLTGTTGASGKITVSAHTNGNIYIENRFATARGFSFVCLAG